MTEQEAVQIAIKSLKSNNTNFDESSVVATREERHMSLGKKLKGWVVFAKLNVSPSFEPNSIHVEVYEPDGAVYIPPLL